MIMTFCFVFFAYASAVVSVRHGLISLIVHSTICPIRDQQSLVFTRTFGFESAYLFVQHIRFPPKLNKNKLNKTKVPADKREYHRRVNFSSSTVFVILPNSSYVLLLFFFVRSTKIAGLSSKASRLVLPLYFHHGNRERPQDHFQLILNCPGSSPFYQPGSVEIHPMK